MELQDYKGPYKPDLTYSDFSKDFLLANHREVRACYLKQAEIWWWEIEQMFDHEVAEKLELIVWTRIAREIQARTARILGIQLPITDLHDLAKILQMNPDSIIPVSPGGNCLFPHEFEFLSDKHTIMTFKDCAILTWIERKAPDPDKRIQSLCGTIEEAAMGAYCTALNPNMKCKQLIRPPRKSPSDIACQWDIWLP